MRVKKGPGTSDKGWNSSVAFDLGSSSCQKDSVFDPYLINRPSCPLAFVVACTESKDFVTEQAIIAASIIITGVILAIKPAAVDSARATIERRLKDLPPSVRVHCSSLNWILLTLAFCPWTEIIRKYQHFSQNSESISFRLACLFSNFKVVHLKHRLIYWWVDEKLLKNLMMNWRGFICE